MFEPAAAIRMFAESIGREARRELVELVVAAWVDAVPERELATHYEKAVSALSADDLRELAGWPGAGEGAVALANPQFLVAAFPSLAGRRRATLRRAACFRAVAAFDMGVTETKVLATVLPCLSRERLEQLARECSELYLADHLGAEN
jgi:hypothetical protein